MNKKNLILVLLWFTVCASIFFLCYDRCYLDRYNNFESYNILEWNDGYVIPSKYEDAWRTMIDSYLIEDLPEDLSPGKSLGSLYLDGKKYYFSPDDICTSSFAVDFKNALSQLVDPDDDFLSDPKELVNDFEKGYYLFVPMYPDQNETLPKVYISNKANYDEKASMLVLELIILCIFIFFGGLIFYYGLICKNFDKDTLF